MATNDFKPFATGAGANVTSQEDWEALAALVTGFQSGKASSAQVNKAIRQATTVGSVVGQFIADKTGQNVLDDGNVSGLVTQLGSALSLFTSLSGVIDKNGYISIPINISGEIKKLLIQWGSGQINAHTGTVSFPTPYSITPFIVIPSKIADNNRYINAVNYTKTGFDIYGFIPSGDGNIDSYNYVSIGW